MVSADNTVLVVGATGRVGRLVVDELLRAGVCVRALTRRPEDAALPAGAEITGSPARTFHQWAADNAQAFARVDASARTD